MPTDNSTSYFFISLMNGTAWGGSEELWYKTALYLTNKGVKTGCAVYHWPEKDERLKVLKAAGCKVYLLPNRKRKSIFFLNLFAKLQYKTKLAKSIKQLPLDQYETVIINQGGFEVYTSVWKSYYKHFNNYILLFHNYDEQQTFSTAQKKSLKGWIQHASFNLFAARQMLEILQKQLNVDIKNAAVFINPITFDTPQQPAKYPGLENENLILSMFGALDVHRKAQDKLVKIMSTQKWKERPWMLFLYGEGRDKDSLQKLIADKGLQKKIILKGHIADVAEAIKNTHLVLQLTNIDAMPLSVIEAMAIGRPLAVTRIGDMPLWICEDENGWLCDTDETSIEACLEKAWQAREQWEEMGKRSFQFFQHKFPKRVEENFLELIKSGKNNQA